MHKGASFPAIGVPFMTSSLKQFSRKNFQNVFEDPTVFQASKHRWKFVKFFVVVDVERVFSWKPVSGFCLDLVPNANRMNGFVLVKPCRLIPPLSLRGAKLRHMNPFLFRLYVE
jgi:hypothetical protein